MILGRIVSDTEIDLGERFQCFTELPSDGVDVPVIYIGMDKTGRILEDRGVDINLIDRRISDNEFWTFTKKEHRTYHATDLIDFRSYCYDLVIREVKYEFIDPLLMTEDAHDKLFAKIKNSEHLISINVGDMVFLFNGDITYGMNILFYQFMGVDRERFLNRVKKISTDFLNTEEILIEYNDFMGEYEDEFMYIPFIYSVKNQCQLSKSS